MNAVGERPRDAVSLIGLTEVLNHVIAKDGKRFIDRLRHFAKELVDFLLGLDHRADECADAELAGRRHLNDLAFRDAQLLRKDFLDDPGVFHDGSELVAVELALLQSLRKLRDRGRLF